jgi:hypothetical protein
MIIQQLPTDWQLIGDMEVGLWHTLRWLFQMWNFQKYWSQNVGQDFIVHDFFHGRKILKVDGRDGRDPQNREKNAAVTDVFPILLRRRTWMSINGIGTEIKSQLHILIHVNLPAGALLGIKGCPTPVCTMVYNYF